MYEFLSYRVKHAMTSDPVTIAPERPLAEAQALFDRHDFNALPVVEEGRVVGILTKLDALAAFAFEPGHLVPPYEEIVRRPVRDQMSERVESVDPELPLTRVLESMRETRYRALPVIEGGRLVGMIARADVLRALRRAVAGEPAPPRG